MTTRKYNPGFLTDDELVSSFCVRTGEFESIVEMLRECTGSANPHQIVIGPRGSGKTSLLLRVAVEVRRDAELHSDFFPILLLEENYGIANDGMFWLECLSRLADQVPHKEDAPDLHRTCEDLRTILGDQTLAERCLGALLDFSDREGKRLVLMVENLNMIFGDMEGPDVDWRLRKVLQTEPRIILLASATSRFDEIDNPDRALYDLFRIRWLRPLDTNECAVLWETVSSQPSLSETIRSLEILTGGSPRLLAILARFGAGRSFRELMAELLDLVDDHTEYFKSHIESLPAQERRVYLALAELWKPATAKEIAARARLTTNKISAQLKRLTERGAVRIEGGTARRKQYYLTERLYNIYYLLRRNRGPDRLVEALIRFMELYYSSSELKDMAIDMIGEAGSNKGEIQLMKQIMINKIAESPRLAAEHREELREIIPEVFTEVPEQTSAPPNNEQDELSDAKKLFNQAVSLDTQNLPEDAVVAFDEVVERFGVSESLALLELVAKALVNKGIILIRQDRLAAAVAVYDEVVERFGDSESPALLEPVAKALLNKGSIFGRQNDWPTEVAVYDEVVERFGDSESPALLEQVAQALFLKGIVLDRQNDWPAELAVYDEVVERFGDSESPALLEQVAQALFLKGIVLEQNDWPAELLEPVAKALLNKGIILIRQDRLAAAVAVYGEVVERFGDSESPALLEQVAKALVNEGSILDRQDRLAAAVAVYDEVVERFGDSESPALLEQVAKALVNKGNILDSQDRLAAAVAVYDEVVERFGVSESPALLEPVAKALLNKGIILISQNRLAAAVAVYDEVVERFGVSESPALLEPVAKALLNKGIILDSQDRLAAAVAVYDEVVERFGDSESPALLEQVAKALVNKGVILSKLNRPEDALVAFDEVVERFGVSESPALLEQVAKALVNKGVILSKLNRPEDALVAFDEVVRRSESPENRWQAHSIRAKVILSSGDRSASEQDIAAILAILPKLDSLTKDSLDELMMFSIEIGPERMVELIQASPSANLLLPLTTALEQELGREPRVAREVAEVAGDIRKDLARLRKTQSHSVE